MREGSPLLILSIRRLEVVFGQRLLELKERKGDDLTLRVAVQPGGCEGFSYEFKFVGLSSKDSDDMFVISAIVF
jgi:Fe-S cluster assembly iron-binding protein IscA